ncbi:glycoside hydrolase family 31 protein [Pyronema domesticum]|uniref:alpha-D-xyloside xylohydrolase n=1 Tax=Pyronema omphalodes (strain CBS 100304) TaxID=1076935 RepID=U4L2G1_PYROM|nr:glycoside hydrolase family 31 protein [Pyronema domesticum]CCX09392.1 Similar to Alpha-xylosidase; acc. no. P31434 [Pyronema omphalodes CBS 100304]
MKFRDGMWLLREEFKVEYAEEVRKIDVLDEDTLSLLCPTRQIHSRGDTLNRAVVTIDIKPEFNDVISITATHWKGGKKLGPQYPLYPDGKPSLQSTVIIDDAGTTLTAGNLSCTVSGKPNTFDIKFTDVNTGKAVTKLGHRSVGFAYNPPPGSPMQMSDMTKFSHYMFTQHNLGVGEGIYGLGERFTAFNKVGQQVSLYNSDGGTSSEQAYKNISFYLSSFGYGVFIDHAEPLDLEIGSERTSRLQTSVKGQKLKWYLIYGPHPKDVLRKYLHITGHPGVVPAWSHGLWLSTSFTTDYDESTVSHFINGMVERSIPVHVFHYDCFWLREFHWCDFVFSPTDFPDPAGMLSSLRTAHPGIKFSIWINPYLGDASPLFTEAASSNFLLRRKNGDIWQWDLWQAGMGIIDFTNPAACDWFVTKIHYLLSLGIDTIKTDFGERIPDVDVAWHDETVAPEKMHNYYSYLYNQLVYRAIQSYNGPHEAILFSRSATAGTQRFPIHWGGDCESSFEAMAESVRGGLSLCLSGFAHWSVDIGGFEGSPDPAVYKRWVAFGLLCSHSRLHGSNSYRVPWLIDEESVEVLRKFTELKCRLMPYIYSHSVASRSGKGPVSLRAMCLEFPDDPTAWTCDRQFMLGDSLLVAPVMSETGEVEYYLPEGRWTNFFTQEQKHGPRWVKEKHGYLTLPLWIREGSIVPLGKEGENRVVWDYWKDLEVRCYAPTEGRGWREMGLVDTEGGDRGVLKVQEGRLAVHFLEGRVTVVVDGKMEMEGVDLGGLRVRGQRMVVVEVESDEYD